MIHGSDGERRVVVMWRGDGSGGPWLVDDHRNYLCTCDARCLVGSTIENR